jgi:hypothetical protein
MQSDLAFGTVKPKRHAVLLSAAVGFGLGLFIWATALMSMVSLVEGQLNDFGSEPVAWDCESDSETLSLEQQVLFVEECATPTPVATASPTMTPTPANNRLDCEEIRGTDYLSSEERTWFLDNCVRR